MNRGGSRLLACVLSVLLAAFAAGAQPASSRVVEIEVVGSDEAVARLRVAATEVLGRLGLTAVVSAERSQPGTAPVNASVLAQAYVDLGEPSVPRLVVVETATRRELARRTLSTTGSLETSIESVTLVLYMVMEGLLSQNASSQAASAAPPREASSPATRDTSGGAPPARPAREERPEPVKAERSPPPTRAASDEEEPPEPERLTADDDAEISGSEASRRFAPSQLAWGAGAFLRVTSLDNTHALTGAGASLELHSTPPGPRPGVLLFGAVHTSTEVGSGDTRAELETASGRLLATLELPWGRRAAGLLGIGGGADWFRADTRSPTLGRGYSTSFLDAALCALLGVRLAIAEPIVASAAASLDVDFEPREFVARSGGTSRTLFELERFRPALMLGLGYAPGFSRKVAQ